MDRAAVSNTSSHLARQKKVTMCLCHRHKHVAITLIRHAITLASCYHRAPLLLSWQQLIWQTGEFSIVIPEAALCERWICSESNEWAKTKIKIYHSILMQNHQATRSLNSQNGVISDFSATLTNAILTHFPLPFPLDDFIERQDYLAVACFFIFLLG